MSYQDDLDRIEAAATELRAALESAFERRGFWTDHYQAQQAKAAAAGCVGKYAGWEQVLEICSEPLNAVLAPAYEQLQVEAPGEESETLVGFVQGI